MSDIAGKIITGQDKDGMLRRALERIIQLYTDKSHFVYELLQNAEDAGATSIRFVQYTDRLEVLHNGSPFTTQNLQGLCDIGKSDKVDNLNQIGEFGVGFKSVFGICDTVQLYSDPSHFRSCIDTDAVPFAIEIVNFTEPRDIPSQEIGTSYTTKFVFPYVVGKSFSGFKTVPELNQVLSEKLQNLGITTLLFMKSLECIEYSIEVGDSVISGSYIVEKKSVNDHCMWVSALGYFGDGSDAASEESYLKFSRQINTASGRTIDIAFPVQKDDNGKYICKKAPNPYVSVYFPTETESKLDLIVQGPYRTTPNRSSIPADDPDNKALAKLTADLLRDTVIELRDKQYLNMSFLKVLPLSERAFVNYRLFLPLYLKMRELFSTEAVIPCLSECYSVAKYARIARQDKLVSLLPDGTLSDLIHTGGEYHWLPTELTETNREFEQVYRFLTGDLKIPVVRPEDLRQLFSSNPEFLPTCSDDWLVDLYTILENVGGAFVKTRNEANMLTAEIIKTTTGKFVAPYRRIEGKQYIPNVFIPVKSVRNKDILFVDRNLYNRCRHFFDDILQITKPNEYEFGIRELKTRYGTEEIFDKAEHAEDIKFIIRYFDYPQYRDELRAFVRDSFAFLCKDGSWKRNIDSAIYIPKTTDGLNLEQYFANVNSNVAFADADYYYSIDVTIPQLTDLGIRESIVVDGNITNGIYDNGSRGRGAKPSWYSTGEFRWKLSLQSIKNVLKYISTNPDTPDSWIKSQVIMRFLLQNEEKLSGTVHISGSTQDLENEPCELLKVLRGERSFGWNGRWLYTDSMDLVSPRDVSKHDISTDMYGKLVIDSRVYDLLRFKKTEADTADELRGKIPKQQLDAFFENELRQRLGISFEELRKRIIDNKSEYGGDDNEFEYSFPIVPVKNWDALRKHAAEMMLYADPVSFVQTLRRIRASDNPKEVKAYLHNMYRYSGTYRYACQICHEASATTENTQLFNNPKYELYPLNLCLCPNCASKYREIRRNEGKMGAFRRTILELQPEKVVSGEQVCIPIDDIEIWFSQTHFAEVQELLKLSDEMNTPEKNAGDELIPTVSPEENQDIGKTLIGKVVLREKDQMQGIIEAIDSQYVHIKVQHGEKCGKTIKVKIEFFMKENSIYSVLS